MTEMNDDQMLAVSAYLDGEATSDERALVESSPELLAEVEALGQVRTVLGATVEPISLSSREAHLAAALDVFERMSEGERLGESTPADGVGAAAAAAVSTPPSSSDTGRHRRPPRYPARWLLGAAAAGLLLIGGAVVVRGINSDDGADFDASDAAPAATEAGDGVDTELDVVDSAIADELLDAEATPVPDAVESDDAFSADEAGAGDDGGLFAEESEETSDAMEEAEGDADTADDRDAAFDEPAPPPEDDELTPLDNLDDLAAFATLALPALGPDATVPAADIDFEPVPGSCEAKFDVQERAGFASYQGTPVLVGIDLVNRIVIAYSTDGCVEVARTALPTDVNGGDG